MKDIKQHFKEFLEKEGAYEEFCKNLGHDFKEFNYSYVPQIISGAFIWPYIVDEDGLCEFIGDVNWSKLDLKWRNHLKTIEQ